MSRESVDVFISEVKASLKKHFKNYRIQILFKTPRSFKANIFLDRSLFIALRYNARNERTDFALIHNNQRIFGYDNLKEWHCQETQPTEISKNLLNSGFYSRKAQVEGHTISSNKATQIFRQIYVRLSKIYVRF